jgi:hypothetical protein
MVLARGVDHWRVGNAGLDSEFRASASGVASAGCCDVRGSRPLPSLELVASSLSHRRSVVVLHDARTSSRDGPVVDPLPRHRVHVMVVGLLSPRTRSICNPPCLISRERAKRESLSSRPTQPRIRKNKTVGLVHISRAALDAMFMIGEWEKNTGHVPRAAALLLHVRIHAA